MSAIRWPRRRPRSSLARGRRLCGRSGLRGGRASRQTTFGRAAAPCACVHSQRRRRRHDAPAFAAGQRGQLARDLHGELAGGNEHESGRTAGGAPPARSVSARPKASVLPAGRARRRCHGRRARRQDRAWMETCGDTAVARRAASSAGTRARRQGVRQQTPVGNESGHRETSRPPPPAVVPTYLPASDARQRGQGYSRFVGDSGYT